uniref:CRISPR-associated protein n=2 Tax=viral metagenome TaxID=1070528 RepID=A0A6M3XZY7_9ZZZZ
MRELVCKLWMESYIAHPFWPETNTVINIQKQSGMNRAQSDAGRDKALKGHLQNLGLTMDNYDRLIALSKRQWYRTDNTNPKSSIVIPRHHLAGALVQTVNTTPASVKGKYKVDSFRASVRLSDFVTEKIEKDSVFGRFVKLEKSNQRSWQENESILEFEAIGTIEIADGEKTEGIERLFAWCLSEVGVGAARKMGYGRGHVLSLRPATEAETKAEAAT